MKIEETWSYDARADQVFRMLLDPAFQDAKCAATGALSHSAHVTEVSSEHVIETHREMATDGLPDNIARIVGKTLKIVEVQRWTDAVDDDTRTADINVSIEGLPISYVGRIRMTPDGDRTDMRISGDLRAKIPLVGGKVESAAAPAISEGVQIEAQTGKKYLAG